MLSLLLAGCATPVRYTEKPLTRYDKTTEYRIDDRAGGFMVFVEYERYQFIPESSAVATACRAMLTSLAYETADARGRKIQPPNEQRVRLSMCETGSRESRRARQPSQWTTPSKIGVGSLASRGLGAAICGRGDHRDQGGEGRCG
jgi:hypothetical protein